MPHLPHLTRERGSVWVDLLWRFNRKGKDKQSREVIHNVSLSLSLSLNLYLYFSLYKLL